ncbi:MAG: DEAD/DEAH box helicase [Alphaproteobacteria bacterium]
MTLALSAPSWRFPPRNWQDECLGAIRIHLLLVSAEPAVVSAVMGSGKSLVIEELCAIANLAKDEVIVVSTSTQLLVEELASAIEDRCGASRSVGFWYGRKKRLGSVIVSCYDSTLALTAKLASAGKKVALWIADECHRTECETVIRAYEQLRPAHAIGMTATPFRADSKWGSISLFKRLLFRYTAAQAQIDKVVAPWHIVHSKTGGELDEVCLGMIQGAVGPGLVNAVSIADSEAFAKRLTATGTPASAVHSRMSRAGQRRAISRLKGGDLRCIVHVNMLSEGANFPWLRWLCLRREVDSRVRFVQEVGRLLRVFPGKERAVFYDPHDLFGTFSLAYEEALGEPPEKPEWEGVLPEPGEIAERIHDADDAVALAWIESVIRSLVVTAEATGFLLDRKTIRKADRLVPSTLMQHVALTEELGRIQHLVPQGWMKCLGSVMARPMLLRYGFAADLLALVQAAQEAGRWPDIEAKGRTVDLIHGDGGQLQFAGCEA